MKDFGGKGIDMTKMHEISVLEVFLLTILPAPAIKVDGISAEKDFEYDDPGKKW